MKRIAIAMAASAMLVAPAIASEHGHGSSHAEAAGGHANNGPVADSVIAKQRQILAANTKGKASARKRLATLMRLMARTIAFSMQRRHIRR